MHFGSSPRTAETERRMTAWRQAHPDATTAEYNRAYEAMWDSLERYSDKEVFTDYETHSTLHREELKTTHRQPVYYESRKPKPPRRPKHGKPPTKGAFGKKR